MSRWLPRVIIIIIVIIIVIVIIDHVSSMRPNRFGIRLEINLQVSDVCVSAKLNVAADVDVEKPDEKSIMTYVSQFMEKYTEMEMVHLTTVSQVS